MVLLLVFMQLTLDLFAIAMFLLILRHTEAVANNSVAVEAVGDIERLTLFRLLHLADALNGIPLTCLFCQMYLTSCFTAITVTMLLRLSV